MSLEQDGGERPPKGRDGTFLVFSPKHQLAKSKNFISRRALIPYSFTFTWEMRPRMRRRRPGGVVGGVAL